MNSTRLKQIEEIYHSAADRDRGERDDFIREKCGEDENLRREVISLLSYEEISDSFIDSAPDAIAAEMFADEKPDLIGSTIGHYTIKRLIGLGGMGEVYLADDTLLNRKVALKLVPPDLARYRGHLNRFKQEAKAASALNHPNILTIHEFGADGSSNYIVSEYVDGVTLRQKISSEVLSGNETLDVATQVASALAAAHEKGIVHRDIKPENIMIRRDGIVKVLDFGLAKLTMPAAPSTQSGTEDHTLLKTAPGSVMGTAAYMSPEQARGIKVDARTDIWSLGIVIYEMVTGRRPFKGETQTDVLAAILSQPAPALDDLVSDVPPELGRIIEQALTKNADERYQNVGEMISDLKKLSGRLEFEAELNRSQRSREIIPDAVTEVLPAVGAAALLESPIISQPLIVDKPKGRKFGVALAVSLVFAVLLGALVWKFGGADKSAEVAADTRSRPVPRVLTYSLTVQSFTDGHYKEPFRLSGEMLFRNGDRVRLNVKGSQDGHLYILNQGPGGTGSEKSFNILFPSPTANNGSELLAADQSIQIPQQSWFQLDSKEGTERLWLLWSEKAIPELESAKKFANEVDRGRINDPELSRSIDQILQTHESKKADIERDDDKKETRITANTDIVAYTIKLEHH